MVFRPLFGPQLPRCQRFETNECVQLRVSAPRTAPKPRGSGCMSPAPYSKHVRVGRPYQCHSFQLHSCSTQALSPGKLCLIKVQIPSNEMYTSVSQSVSCMHKTKGILKCLVPTQWANIHRTVIILRTTVQLPNKRDYNLQFLITRSNYG